MRPRKFGFFTTMILAVTVVALAVTALVVTRRPAAAVAAVAAEPPVAWCVLGLPTQQGRCRGLC